MNNSFLLNWRVPVGIFDLDGNILAPDTPCYVIEISTGNELTIPAHQLDQHPELISGPTAIYRWKDDIEDSMIHFRDFDSHREHGGPDRLIQDVKNAIEHKHFSPSFTAFKETFLIRARLFAIITARWHSADNLSRAITTINEEVLSKNEKIEQLKNIRILYQSYYPHLPNPTREQALQFYFQIVGSYYPVNNIHAMKSLGMTHIKSSAQKKTFCMNHYIQDIRTRILAPLWYNHIPQAIWFSDDSVTNMMAMLAYFLQEKEKWNLYNDSIHLYFSGKQWSLPIPETKGIIVTQESNMTILQL